MDGQKEIKGWIKSIVPISEDDSIRLSEFISFRTLPKNNLLLKENQVCHSIAFLKKGTLIYYKTLDNGTDITTDFAFEGDWVTNNHSRPNQSPSHLNIKAIEESELFVIRQDDLSRLYLEFHTFEIEQKSSGLQKNLFSTDCGAGIGYQFFIWKGMYLQAAFHFYYRKSKGLDFGETRYEIPNVDLSPVIRIGYRFWSK